MAIETKSPTTRRNLLVGALGGVAAWAAGAFGRPDVARAGVDGDVVLGTLSSNPYGTAVQATGGNLSALTGWSSSTFGSNAGLRGVADSADNGTIGVSALASGSSGATYGVFAETMSPAGIGVQGQGATGVRGVALTAGTGGWFSSGTGNALRADGKVHFSRSGRVTIAASHSSKTISLTGVTTASHVFAMIGSNRAGRWVRAVVPTTGKFTIYLNTTVSSNTYVHWFVLD